MPGNRLLKRAALTGAAMGRSERRSKEGVKDWLAGESACPTMCTRVGQTLSSVNRERFLNYGKRITVKFFSVTVSADCTVFARKSTVTPAV